MTAPEHGSGPAAASRDAVLEAYRAHVGVGAARLAESLGAPVERDSAGSYLWDTDGRQYLQCGGYGVFILGHRHPEVVAALHRQLDRHPLATRTLLSAELADAATALTAVAPAGLERVYFGCTGAEAVETAFKLARANGRRRIVAMRGGFHGKTFGALSATDRLAFQQPFRPLLSNVEMVPYGDVDALATTLAEGDPACVILEPVQGEGGVRIPPDGYLAQVSQVCRRSRALLVVDEIQTGLGRLGTWWGWDVPDACPDLLLVGKALGGGCVPVSAVLATAEVFSPLDRNPRLHSSTFSAYPLGMAAVSATMAVLRTEEIPARAARLGARLDTPIRAAFAKLPATVVRDVRSRGLLFGFDFASPALAGRFSHALLESGVIATSSLGADTVVRLTPPAVLSESDVDWLLGAVAGAVERLEPAAVRAEDSSV
jgi:putrescine aminotransferase